MDNIKQELLRSGKIDTSRIAKVPQQRLDAFESGSTRRSVRDKQKEADEQRRAEEERQTQEAYKEYLNAFDNAEPSSFVRAGKRRKANEAPSVAHSSTKPTVQLNSQGKIKGKTQMDSFMQELKREQAGRGSSSAARPELAAASDVDPLSTNLYVANLPTNIDERVFGEHFAHFGDIASVKILWPRADEATKLKQPGYAGFISYMTRKDAENAHKQLDGSDWQGHVLKVDWGKRIRIPSRPIFECTAKPLASSRSRSPSNTALDQRDSKRTRLDDGPSQESAFDDATVGFLLSVVSRARYHDDGPVACLQELEARGGDYAFLGNKGDPRFAFVHSELDLDIPFDDNKDTAAVDDELSDEEHSEHEALQKQKDSTLGPLARQKLENMLRLITPKRLSVAKAMTFAIDHAEAYADVVNIVIKSLLNVSTPVPRKIARLHLVSDILANSAVGISGAWKYRDEIQRQLPRVFDHLGLVKSTFPSKLSQNFFKERVQVVLGVWEELFIFPQNILDDYLMRLESGGKGGRDLHGSSTLISQSQSEVQSISNSDRDAHSSNPITPVAEEMVKPAGFKAMAQAEDNEDEDIDGEAIDDDIDGEAMPDPVDGEPLHDDIDGEPMQDDDIDGEPMQVQDDLDGEPMADDDIDGEPM